MVALVVLSGRTLSALPGFPKTVQTTTIHAVEEVARPGYSLMVPYYSSDFYRENFLFAEMDDVETRVLRYRAAFVAAIMQPMVTARLKETNVLMASVRNFAARLTNAVEISSDARHLLQTVANATGAFTLDPSKIGATLNGVGDSMGEPYLKDALGGIGTALAELEFVADLSSKAWNEILLHALLSSTAERRISCLEEFLAQHQRLDLAIYAGFADAKDDVREFLTLDRSLFASAIRAVRSELGDNIVEAGPLARKLGKELELISGSVATSIRTVVYPYFLAYQTGAQVVNENRNIQEICAGATLDSLLFLWFSDLVDDLEQSDGRDYEALRKKALTVMELRHGIGYWYNAKYDEVLALDGDLPDWVLGLLERLKASYDDMDGFRREVLWRYMERNLQAIRQVGALLELKYNLAPVLSSVTVEPTRGDATTVFSFRAEYSDADGNGRGPAMAKFVIDGHSYSAFLVEGPVDAGTYLVQLRLPVGAHSFSATFFDADYAQVASPLCLGPFVETVSTDVAARLELTGVPEEVLSECFGVKYAVSGLPGHDVSGRVLANPGVIVTMKAGATIDLEAWSAVLAVRFVGWKIFCGGMLSTESTAEALRGVAPGNCTELRIVAEWQYVEELYSVGGAVMGPRGPLENVVMRLEPSERETATGADGRFSFEGVPAGPRYVVSPSLPGFAFFPASVVLECLQGDRSDLAFRGVPGDRSPPEVEFAALPGRYVDRSSGILFTWRGKDNLTEEALLEYRYRVIGSESGEWSAWSGEGRCVLSLANGVYRLEVQARDEAGNVSCHRAAFSFAVTGCPRITQASLSLRGTWLGELEVTAPAGCADPQPKVCLSPIQFGLPGDDFVPVRLLTSDGEEAIGTLPCLQEDLGLPVVFTETALGYLVELPEAVGEGQTARYLIQWGRLVEMGWRKRIGVPEIISSSGSESEPWVSVLGVYLDAQKRFWRLFAKSHYRVYPWSATQDSYLWLEVWDEHGALLQRDLVEFSPADYQQEGNGFTGTARRFVSLGDGFVETERGMRVFWRTEDYEVLPSEDKTRCGYAAVTYNPNTLVKSVDVSYSPTEEGTCYGNPTALPNGEIWLTGSANGGKDVVYSRMSADGQIIAHGVLLASAPGLKDSYIDDRFSLLVSLDEKLWFFYSSSWMTANDKERGELYLVILNGDGTVFKGAERIGPPAPDGSGANHDFPFFRCQPVFDKTARAWVSYGRNVAGQVMLYYYAALGPDGSLAFGPVQEDLTIRFVDYDGWLWVQSTSGLWILDPNQAVVEKAPLGAWVPNATAGAFPAILDPAGFRVFDRWSVQSFDVPGAPSQNAAVLQVRDVDWNVQGVQTSNLRLEMNGDVLLSVEGPTETTLEVDLGERLRFPGGTISCTQDAAFGGEVLMSFRIPEEPWFVRGDVNQDGRFDISDPIVMLGHLFAGRYSLDCLDAVDANDDSRIDVSDAIYLLSWRFRGGPSPNAPFPDCGADLTEDDVSCYSYSLCDDGR